MKFFKNCLIVIFMTIVLTAMLEIAARMYLFSKTGRSCYLLGFEDIRPAKQQKTKTAYGDFYSKFAPGSYENKQGNKYTINTKGFRNQEFTERNNTKKIRIFCMGGSSTAGLGSPDDSTYSCCLEKILNKKFEVINTGISGYKMEDIYKLFREEIIDYDPDAIIIYSAFNDIVHGKITGLSLFLFRSLYCKSMLYTMLIEKVNTVKYGNPWPYTHETQLAVESYFENLKNLIALAKQNNMKVILVKQPLDIARSVYFNKEIKISPKEENIKSLTKKIKAISSFINSASLAEKRFYIYHLFLKQIEYLGEKNDLIVVDPLDEFKKNKQKYFSDVVHLTVEGNRKLAEIIAKDLIGHKQELGW